jgi:hypothetical protein
LNKSLKIIAITALLGGAAWLYFIGRQVVANWADKITVRISALGIPKYAQNVFNLPVSIVVYNPTPIAVPIEAMRTSLFVARNAAWEKFGETDPVAVALVPGDNKVTIEPRIDLTKLTPIPSGTKPLDYLLALASSQAAVSIQLTLSLTIKGYQFDHSETRTFTLRDLVRNAA